MPRGKNKSYQIAVDAGGTMTDSFLVDEKGKFVLGKALTNRENECLSYIAAITDAASYWGLSSADIHKAALSSTYTGTTMLNVLLTRSGSKVGLLITRGFSDMPILERGLTWIGLSYEGIMHQQSHEHTQWLVEPEHIKEITERISVGSYYMNHHYMPGKIVIPLVEENVVRGVNELLDEGVEYIGILTLGSYVNPIHEKRAAEIARAIVKSRDANVPVVASHEICPLAKENERLKTLLIQCYVAEAARKQLSLVEQAAKGERYKHKLLTLLSYGAVADIRYPKLVEAVISGPVGGLLGSKVIADIIGKTNVVSTDLGGTTFDVGLIIGGMIPVNKEPDFAGHRLRTPMLSIDSIAAGGGIVIHVDESTKRIILGPESAGSRIGTCWKYPDVTITDINLTLGYLNPENFLGGKVSLNEKRALEMVQNKIAKPLGQDVYQVASRVLDLLHSQMCDHIRAMLLSRGLNPSSFTLVASGGGGPLHTWGIERNIGFDEIVMAPWAATFSAFGVASADYFHRYDKAVTVFVTPDMNDDVKLYQGEVLNSAWQELERCAYEELADEGIRPEDVHFGYGVSASYAVQITSWDCPVEKGRVESADDLDRIIESFERVYTMIYPVAARYPEVGYRITEVYIEAVAKKAKPIIPSYEVEGPVPSRKALYGKRKAYMDGKWQEFKVWQMNLLEAGNRVDGPAIIEHPLTTLVIPSTNYVEFDEHRFVWYRRK